MRLNSAAILINKRKKWAKDIEGRLKSLLLENNVQIKSPKNAQIIITIGGDGTMLYYKHFSKPILGIGSKSSWICQCKNGNCKKYISSILRQGFSVEKRTMLSSWLDGKKLPDALNEVAIRNREHRILNLRLFIGKKRHAFMADGLMFSTATGSPAYAYSCGGKEMPPLSKNYQIVAIAPYRRAFNPKIVEPSTTSHLHVDSTCKADAVVDGQYEVPVKRKCCLMVKKSKEDALFVKKKK